MKGEDAIAEALRVCADRCYTVAGYPVTGIAEKAGAEHVINEKVALEYALGDSLSQRRAAVITKNVGLNACADPLVHATSHGLIAGVVIVTGDDLDARGTAVVQDSRYYAEVAQVPLIEPDPATCHAGIEEAFAVSEKFSRVSVVRVTPALLEAEVQEGRCTRRGFTGQRADPSLTMRGRSTKAELAVKEMFAWSHLSRLNRLRGGSIGVGAAHGNSHVVTSYPPPAVPPGVQINELGRPFLKEHLCLEPPGGRLVPETYAVRGYYRTFCRHCPFKALLQSLKERDLAPVCDMGCAILAPNPPYRLGFTGYGLGSSIAVAARSTRVALIGDYALLHSGINALLDVSEKGLPLLCIVMKNRRMGMTGGQRTYDPVKYLKWAEPVLLTAQDADALREGLVIPGAGLRLLVVEGECPEGEEHERVECRDM